MCVSAVEPATRSFRAATCTAARDVTYGAMWCDVTTRDGMMRCHATRSFRDVKIYFALTELRREQFMLYMEWHDTMVISRHLELTELRREQFMPMECHGNMVMTC